MNDDDTSDATQSSLFGVTEDGCHIVVRLTWSEVFTAATAGIMRQVENLRRNRVDAYGAAKCDGWRLHIEGAAGEMAAAKALGVYWSGRGEFRGADIGTAYQVRTALSHEQLIVHKSDSDEQVFILVTGQAPNFVVRGWIVGREAKRDVWWKDPVGGRPAYFVPALALAPIQTLSERHG